MMILLNNVDNNDDDHHYCQVAVGIKFGDGGKGRMSLVNGNRVENLGIADCSILGIWVKFPRDEFSQYPCLG